MSKGRSVLSNSLLGFGYALGLGEEAAHRDFWERRNFCIYEYDPTDDGPEVETITRILAADWYYEIDREREATEERRCGVIKSRYHV